MRDELSELNDLQHIFSRQVVSLSYNNACVFA